MSTSDSEKSREKVCDLSYLTEMMGGKKHLVRGIMDLFLTQVPEELKSIHDAVSKIDYAVIKSFAHTMKSSVTMLGISSLVPILREMESLGEKAEGIEKIKELDQKLNLICLESFAEVEREKLNYI